MEGGEEELDWVSRMGGFSTNWSKRLSRVLCQIWTRAETGQVHRTKMRSGAMMSLSRKEEPGQRSYVKRVFAYSQEGKIPSGFALEVRESCLTFEKNAYFPSIMLIQ